LKTQLVQNSKQLKEMIDNCNQRMTDQSRKHETEMAFVQNERKYNQQTIDTLQLQLSSLSKASGSKRPVVPTFATDFMRQRNSQRNCLNFSPATIFPAHLLTLLLQKQAHPSTAK